MAGRDDIDRLQSLLDAVEEMLLRQSDDQELDGARVTGETGIGRAIIDAALKKDGQRRMEVARAAMLTARGRADATSRAIPSDPVSRRQLLQKIMASQSGLAGQLTNAFRGGTEMTDAEVDSVLAALQRVGALDNIDDLE
jgi:hypothetical protein